MKNKIVISIGSLLACIASIAVLIAAVGPPPILRNSMTTNQNVWEKSGSSMSWTGNVSVAGTVTATNGVITKMDVRLWGATGGSDDTIAFQDAINYGVTNGVAIYIPTGTWNINPLVVPVFVKSLIMIGDGTDHTIIKLITAGTLLSFTGTHTGVSISRMSFAPASSGVSSSAINWTGVSRGNISDVNIIDNGSGVFTYGVIYSATGGSSCYFNTISKLRLLAQSQPMTTLLYLSGLGTPGGGPNGLSVIGLECVNSLCTNAVTIDNSAQISFNSCSFEQIQYGIIVSNSCSAVEIQNSYFESITNYGVLSLSTSPIVSFNNYLSASSDSLAVPYTTFGTASGSSGQLQYNNAGSLAGTSITYGGGFITSKLGIGESPLTILDIKGDQFTQDALTLSQLITSTNAYNNNPFSGIGFANIYTSGGGLGILSGLGGGKENNTDGNFASFLGFYTRPNGSTISENMRITSAGVIKSLNNSGGFSSASTITGSPTATGWTNSTSVNVILYVTAATGASLTNNAGTAEFSGVTIAAFTPIRVQPNGVFVGTGISYATGPGAHAW